MEGDFPGFAAVLSLRSLRRLREDTSRCIRVTFDDRGSPPHESRNMFVMESPSISRAPLRSSRLWRQRVDGCRWMTFDDAFAECSRKGLRHVSPSNHGSSEIPAHHSSPEGIAALAPLSWLNCISATFRLRASNHSVACSTWCGRKKIEVLSLDSPSVSCPKQLLVSKLP